MNKAVVSVHIFDTDEYGTDIEILSQVDDDYNHAEVFCDINNALLDQVKIPVGKDEYYFMAIVEAEHVAHEHWEGREYDIEYHVTEIKNIADLNK